MFPRSVGVCLSQSLKLSRFYFKRQYSGFERPPASYENHVHLTRLERSVLALGSAAMSFVNPRRADLVAALGETTATPFFIYRLRDVMLSSSTGRRILRDRPRITSQTLSLERLCSLPENSVGRVYASWIAREGVSPDTRDSVRFIDDEECAYVMQRYRDCHDFYHAITGIPVFVEGEVALKAFEFANTLLPMTGLSVLAVARLKPKERSRFWRIYLPWGLLNGLGSQELISIYWEEELERDVIDFRRHLGIEPPPDLRCERKSLKNVEMKGKVAKVPP